MLKLFVMPNPVSEFGQPPSGGCVLKPSKAAFMLACRFQPPSGGCVLKLFQTDNYRLYYPQPPSGGCVLKHDRKLQLVVFEVASRLQAAVC